MKDYAWIFLTISLVAVAKAVFAALWAVLGASSVAGAQLSKKLGTDNEDTDANTALGRGFTRERLKATGWRLGVAGVAYLLWLIFS